MNVKKFLMFGLFASVISMAFADTTTDQNSATSKKYVTDELNQLQNALGPESGTKAVTFTGTAGGVEPREVKSDLGSNTSDSALSTVSAVNTKLDTKQNEIPAVDANTVVTYTDTPGTLGQKGIYQDTETYAEQAEDLIDAGTFNAALKNGLDTEFVCAETDPATGLCWIWAIHNKTENRTANLFDISKIPAEKKEHDSVVITNNGDGTITVTPTIGNSTPTTGVKLSQLAPGLEVGKTYVFSINTTGTKKNIYLGRPADQSWGNGTTKTITQDMLDSQVHLRASGGGTTATIYNIQIEEGTVPTPFQPYNANVYIPQNQQTQQ